MSRPRLDLVGMLAIVGVLAGCADNRPTNYYALQSLSGPVAPPTGSVTTVGVAPVTIPDYLRRQELVSRAGLNRLNVNEFNLWAEPVDAAVTRILADDLGILLKDQKVAIDTDRSADTNYMLSVDVRRFEGDGAGNCVLFALWALRGANNDTVIGRGGLDLKEPIQGEGEDALTAAMNKALEALGRQVAADIAPLIK